ESTSTFRSSRASSRRSRARSPRAHRSKNRRHAGASRTIRTRPRPHRRSSARSRLAKTASSARPTDSADFRAGLANVSDSSHLGIATMLNAIEKAMMNNPVRAAVQRWIEAPRLLAMGGALPAGARALEIGCGRGVGTELVLDAFGAEHVDAFDLD